MSSGEIQHFIIVSQLSAGKLEHTIIPFVSPSIGLGPFSIQNMVNFFHNLTQEGNTPVVAEAGQFSDIADHIINVSYASTH